jgi:hypothetical protein
MQHHAERTPGVGKTLDDIDQRIVDTGERWTKAEHVARAAAEAAGVGPDHPAMRRSQLVAMYAANTRGAIERELGVEVEINVDPATAILPSLAEIDRMLAYRQKRERAAFKQRMRREIKQADRELKQFPPGEKPIGYFALCAQTRDACRAELRRLEHLSRPSTTSSVAATDRGASRPREAGRPRASAARSSARSGDSGDGEPHEPPLRLCACGCGEDLTGERAGAKWATEGCRKRATRAATCVRGNESRWLEALQLADEAAQVQRDIEKKREELKAKRAERHDSPLLAYRRTEDVRGLAEDLQDLYAKLRKLTAGRLALLGVRPCVCVVDGRREYYTWRDNDDDPVCLACGRHRGVPRARLNGHEYHSAVQQTASCNLPDRDVLDAFYGNTPTRTAIADRRRPPKWRGEPGGPRVPRSGRLVRRAEVTA